MVGATLAVALCAVALCATASQGRRSMVGATLAVALEVDPCGRPVC